MSMADWIGWLATAIFAVSYFCRTPEALRRVQGVAALAWAAYGVAIHALPVIVASLAVWTSFARRAAPAPRT